MLNALAGGLMIRPERWVETAVRATRGRSFHAAGTEVMFLSFGFTATRGTGRYRAPAERLFDNICAGPVERATGIEPA